MARKKMTRKKTAKKKVTVKRKVMRRPKTNPLTKAVAKAKARAGVPAMKTNQRLKEQLRIKKAARMSAKQTKGFEQRNIAHRDMDPGKGAPANRAEARKAYVSRRQGGKVVRGLPLVRPGATSNRIRKAKVTPKKATARTATDSRAGKQLVPYKTKADTSRVGKELIPYKGKVRPKGKWGAIAAGAAALAGGASLLRGGKDKKAEVTPEKVKPKTVTPGKNQRQSQDPSIAKKDSNIFKNQSAAIKRKMPAATTAKGTAAQKRVVAPAKVSPDVGKRVQNLRMRHKVAKGGSITGEEAFVAAAATTIAGQVPQIYNTADKIAGFLGKHVKPFGLAGLAAGSTYLIAKYLARRRGGGGAAQSARKVVNLTKRFPKKAFGPRRRPASAYGKGMSNRRKRVA